MVAHVLLVEAPTGLVLVDSGYGLHDADEWRTRLGMSRLVLRPTYAPGEAAITQVRALGYDPADVRDVVLTHFDADHTGGLVDFPWARVHLSVAEADAVARPRTMLEKQRYLAGPRAHGPTLVPHAPGDGEPWRGFAAVRPLAGVSDDVVLVDLPGHTRGHTAVAVDTGERWILHAGDAFYHRGDVDGTDSTPRALRIMARTTAHDRRVLTANRRRLAELWSADNPGCVLVNAHDAVLFVRARNGSGNTRTD